MSVCYLSQKLWGSSMLIHACKTYLLCTNTGSNSTKWWVEPPTPGKSHPAVCSYYHTIEKFLLQYYSCATTIVPFLSYFFNNRLYKYYVYNSVLFVTDTDLGRKRL